MGFLTAKRVEKLLRRGEPGRHFDDAGLYLDIGGKNAAHWTRRFELNGTGHWMGLGSCKAFSLSEARERNRKISQQLADGIDPLAEKRARKTALLATAATKLTFKEATERYVAKPTPAGRRADMPRNICRPCNATPGPILAPSTLPRSACRTCSRCWSRRCRRPRAILRACSGKCARSLPIACATESRLC